MQKQLRRIEGISIEVVDHVLWVPLDKDIIINSVKRLEKKQFLCLMPYKTSGFIGEISAIISESEAFDYLDAQFVDAQVKMYNLTHKIQKM